MHFAIFNTAEKTFHVPRTNSDEIRGIPAIIPRLQSGGFNPIYIFKSVAHFNLFYRCDFIVVFGDGPAHIRLVMDTLF